MGAICCALASLCYMLLQGFKV